MPKPVIRTFEAFQAARRINSAVRQVCRRSQKRSLRDTPHSLGLDAICFSWGEPSLALFPRFLKNSWRVNPHQRQGSEHTVPQVCRIYPRRLAPRIGEERFGARVEGCSLDDVDCQKIGVDVSARNQGPRAGGKYLGFPKDAFDALCYVLSIAQCPIRRS